MARRAGRVTTPPARAARRHASASNDRAPADAVSGRGSYRYPWGLSREFSGEAGDPRRTKYKLVPDATQPTQSAQGEAQHAPGMDDGTPTPVTVPAPTFSYAALEGALSAERLSTFRLPGDDDVTALARYAWNQAVVDALGFPLHLLEVALRNAVDEAGRRVVGVPRRHGGVPSWLDADPPVLAASHAQTVAEAREALRARAAPRTPGRLVAELTLGFWLQLFNVYYDPSTVARGRPGLALWTRASLRAAFPNAPGRFRTREALRTRLDGIRLFRNRLSHHEPVFNRDPAARHREVVATLRWISAPAAEYAAAFDVAPAVIAGGHATYLARCGALLGVRAPTARSTQ